MSSRSCHRERVRAKNVFVDVFVVVVVAVVAVVCVLMLEVLL